MLAGRSAVGLNPEDRTSLLDDGRTLAYDGLVIASGARARRSRTARTNTRCGARTTPAPSASAWQTPSA